MLSGTLRKRIGLLAVTLIAVASIGAQSRPWRQMCDANPTVCEDQNVGLHVSIDRRFGFIRRASRPSGHALRRARMFA
jgi:hypothetical protein